MKTLVTGSSGHLGEALVRTLRDSEHEVVGLDLSNGKQSGPRIGMQKGPLTGVGTDLSR